MEFCTELLRRFGKPIVSTSANFSGIPSPVGYDDISPKLKDMVDYAVPNMPEFVGSDTGSRILKVEADGSITVIRN
jgi:L-threonylcarbamoyladenylate synthase